VWMSVGVNGCGCEWVWMGVWGIYTEDT